MSLGAIENFPRQTGQTRDLNAVAFISAARHDFAQENDLLIPFADGDIEVGDARAFASFVSSCGRKSGRWPTGRADQRSTLAANFPPSRPVVGTKMPRSICCTASRGGHLYSLGAGARCEALRILLSAKIFWRSCKGSLTKRLQLMRKLGMGLCNRH